MKYQQQIDAYIDSKEAELKAALARLICIPSTRGEPRPGMPFGTGPAKALDESLKIAAEWGLVTENYDGYVGIVDVNNRETNLHILCHLDVVDPGQGWNTDPYEMVEQNGILYGRGVDDDKGPAAISMLALRAVKELDIPMKYNARLLLGTDEESESEDIEYYYAREPFASHCFSPDAEFPVINIEKGRYAPDLACAWNRENVIPRVAEIHGGIRINVVPPEASAELLGLTAQQILPLAGQVGQKSGAVFSVTNTQGGSRIQVTGKNAHASTPDEGVNAITALLGLLCELPLSDCGSTRAIRRLSKLFPHGDNHGTALGIDMEDKSSGRLSLTLSLLELDETGLHGRFDSRVPVCGTEESCAQMCENVLNAAGFSCKGEMSPSHYVPEDSPFVQTLLRCYEQYSGRKGFCRTEGGGTYVHDIPGGVAFGAGDLDFDSRLHATNERAKVSNMLIAAKIYAQAIVELCGKEAEHKW